MPNRLASCSSLYLRQHADNPVDWQPWDDQALQEASRLDRPIFLSIGYSSCHWCHVMARECFEDVEVAASLNQHFVCIKLDREERPDIDDVYMAATQMANGHGGWPMSVFLTPDLRPFFAATYIPRAAFLRTVDQLGHAWLGHRDEVLKTAEEFGTALKGALTLSAATGPTPLIPTLLHQAVDAMWGAFDQEFGGFGSKPKFPPYCDLLFLLDYLDWESADAARLERARQMVQKTIHHIVYGGLFDHVGGGFHRYSTDENWHLPHFEKILSDNALAIEVLDRIRGFGDLDEACSSAVHRTLDWLEREMTLPDGAFASALDAGADGVEGRPYVWAWSELEAILGEDLPAFASAYSLKREGNYFDEATRQPSGLNLLHRVEGAPAMEFHLDRLREARNQMAHPDRDPKGVASSNGLVAIALLRTGRAERVESLINLYLRNAPHVPHQTVEGRAEGIGFLDDLAYIATAVCELAERTGDAKYTQCAHHLVDFAVKEFAGNPHGLSLASERHQTPIARQVSVFDSASPNAFASLLLLMSRMGRKDEAAALLAPYMHWCLRAPMGCATLLRCLIHLADHGVDAVETGAPSPLVWLAPTELTFQPDGYAHTVLHIDVPPGHHINSYDPDQDWLVPTSIKIDKAFGEAGFPQGSTPYFGEVQIPVRLMRKGSAREFELEVVYQLCSESACFAPESQKVYGVFRDGG